MRAVIALLPGDGVGPEVMAAGVGALNAVAHRFGHDFELREGRLGGAAVDAGGDPFPPATRSLVSTAHAVLLGAVGGPRWDACAGPERPEAGLLRLRRHLGVYANLRPVRVLDSLVDVSPLRPERLAGVDLVFVRELTGGIYFGEKRRDKGDDGSETAHDGCTYTTGEIERVVREAAGIARRRRGRLVSVDKANVLESSRLWREVTTRVMQAEFPEVALEHVLVDACAMHLLRAPSRFDVLVTENMFGDILTDEASMLAGSIGLLPSASLGSPRAAGPALRAGLYEPIHGSAPDIAGTGAANPSGMILSVAMMLRHSFALEREALAIERAVERAFSDGLRTADLVLNGTRPCSTSQFAERVARDIADGIE
ncbi:MAG: 3-isopropylmalate dehydrogenase [Gemmatimonadaceae bacterium]